MGGGGGGGCYPFLFFSLFLRYATLSAQLCEQYCKLKRFDLTIKYGEQALKVWESAKDPEVSTLVLQGLTCAHVGYAMLEAADPDQLENALALCNRALPMIFDKAIKRRTFETLAKLFSIRRTGDATTNRQSAARYADLAAKQ